MARIPFKAGSPKSFTPMPKGTYLLVVDSVEEQVSKTSGNPMLKITHLVEDHPTYSGRKVIRFMSLSAKATFRLRAMLEAAIPDKVDVTETDDKDEEGNPIFDIDFDTDDLIGARYYCDAGVKENKERGEEEQTWNKEKPYGEVQGGFEEEEQEEEEEENLEAAADGEEQEEAEEAAPEPAKAAQKPATKPTTAPKPGTTTAKPNTTTKPAAKPGVAPHNRAAAPNNGKPAQAPAAGRERTRLRA